MDELLDALPERVAFLLRLALSRAEAMGEQALAELGIAGREYGVLAVLGAGTTSAQRRVGEALGIDRTSTGKLLAGLEARGLVARTPDPLNRRAYLVALTDDGQRLRARAAGVLAECDERFLDPLDDEERAGLRDQLRRLAEL